MNLPTALVPLTLLAVLPLVGAEPAAPSPMPTPAAKTDAKPAADKSAKEVVALAPGEAFTFRVGWGPFSSAGEIKVSAESEMLVGLPHTRVITQTKTTGTIGALYTFTGEAIAHFDAKDGRLMMAKADTDAGGKRTKMSIVFDYSHSKANYVDPLRPARNALLTMPPGHPLDMITALIQARAWNLQPGESHPSLVLFDNDFYSLTITAKAVEKVDTPKGKRDAMLLIPTPDGPPKGMFKKGGAIRVWISNDAERLPLKFEVEVKVGTATATLTDYLPPAKPAPAKPQETAPKK